MAQVLTTSLALNSNGCLEFWVAVPPTAPELVKGLWRQSQTTPNGGDWSGWVPMDLPFLVLNVSTPTLVANAGDNHLELLCSDGQQLWHRWQTRAGDDTSWNAFTPLGSPPQTTVPNSPMVGVNQDGRLELFVIGDDRALWHMWQNRPGDSTSWSQWDSLGAPPSECGGGSPAVGNWHTGALTVIVNDVSGEVWQRSQISPNKGWAQWSSLGSPGSGTSYDPVVAANKDGRLDLFVTDSEGTLWHLYQISLQPPQPVFVDGRVEHFGGPALSDWTALGSPPVDGGAQSLIVVANRSGSLDVLTGATDGALWHLWQQEPGDDKSWSAWTSLDSPTSSTGLPVALAIGWSAAAANQAGHVEVVAAATGDPSILKGPLAFEVYHNSSTDPNSDENWTGWVDFGSPP